MQAGLAILCNADLEFVSETIKQQHCGLTYQMAKPQTLIGAVETFVSDPKRLHAMKHRAYDYARSEFNWEKQSAEYKRIIGDLCRDGRRADGT